jgi:hypothetical protein
VSRPQLSLLGNNPGHAPFAVATLSELPSARERMAALAVCVVAVLSKIASCKHITFHLLPKAHSHATLLQPHLRLHL